MASPNGFSKFTTDELLQQARDISQKLSTKYTVANTAPIQKLLLRRQGNFTVVVLNDEYVGVSKRNSGCDKNNSHTGIMYAMTRAIYDYLGLEVISQ